MKKTIVCLMAAVLASQTVLAFDVKEKRALCDLADRLEMQFRSATGMDGKAITLLPIRGDSDSYFGNLLLNAAVKAGKTVVIPNDPKDSDFARILKEIKWDERQTTLQSIDPATVDRLGKLKSTQVLLEATLYVDKAARKPTAEVFLRAYAIETKQYVWTAHEIVPEGSVLPWWRRLSDRTKAEPSLLRVQVVSDANTPESKNIAVLLDAPVTESVISFGCTSESVSDPDVVVKMMSTRQVFDRTGEYAVFEGTIQAVVRTTGESGKLLGDRIFSVRGRRGLGDLAAEKNLVEATVPQIKAWLKTLLSPSAVGFAATEFELSLGSPVAEVGDFKAPEAIRRAAGEMPGVRSALLVSQDEGKGIFKFRAVYETAKFPGGFLNTLFAQHPELEKAFVD